MTATQMKDVASVTGYNRANGESCAQSGQVSRNARRNGFSATAPTLLATPNASVVNALGARDATAATPTLPLPGPVASLEMSNDGTNIEDDGG